MNTDPQEILNFWFYEVGPNRWFVDDSVLDDKITEKYLTAHEAALDDEYREWEKTPEGMIALLLLLDIFPRHMFRGTARVYETDGYAMDLARQAVIKHYDDRIDRNFKLFFYLPFSHSEEVDNHRLAAFYVRERTKEPFWVDYVNERQVIIECFGRFPHRNKVLGRKSTSEEEEYLKEKKPYA